ncbi:serine/arginine repetitive matrix protein 1-like [Schistocerca gregaria]|uniref:serine/arginine repetitive matrix protein 1-like n=1 Tax=Schistocerca gregaria TaxID=7010 RepID=UPI00211DED0B|nr:serine/arginine repetitive matrix protein 1-like [Schistocerca gregaria]
MALVQPGLPGAATTTAPAAPVSRLAQMQARIQQRQLQEKEQKLLQLYESQQQRALDRVVTRSTSLSSSLSTAAFSTLTTTNNNSVRTSLSNGINNNNNGTVGGGRVRQMFDERRKPNNSAPAAPGWDRSYPLEPINKNATAHKTVSKSRGAASLDRNGAGAGSGHRAAAPPPQAHQPLRRAKSQARPPPPPPQAPSPPPEPEPEPEPQPQPQAAETAEEQDAELQRYLDDFSPPATPPPFDDEPDEGEPEAGAELDAAVDASTSFVFQKLPNVGGPARAPVQLAEERPDRFKTYAAGKPGTRAKGAAAAAPAPAARRPQPARTTVRRSEVKASPPAAASNASTGSKRSPTSRASGGSVTSPQHQTTATRTASNASTASTASKTTPAAKKPPTPTPSAASSSSGSGRQRGGGSLRAVASAPPRDDLVACSNCGRHFATDRVAKHEEICRRTTTKKRKVFDPVKQRVKGTEAETFVRKMLLKGPPAKKETQAKKPDWRKRHEEFIATIRAAKEMKAHLAAGGKLSDLPPPPPLDTSDYIQCPHCQRRFNEAAAERHIPRCANMQHNKKPAPAARTSAGKVGARRR